MLNAAASLESDPSATWRELCRCDDLLQARAVATCIAAMEFDVRLRCRETSSASRMSDYEHNAVSEGDFPGPYIIDVPEIHWLELAGVLDQIIDEQAEFDAWLDLRRRRRNRHAVAALSIVCVAEVLMIMRLID